jgi:hypothetical protein
MAWNNQHLTLYHGTDLPSAQSVVTGIQVGLGRARTDFGKGFYATSWLNQAVYWANQIASRKSRRTGTPVPAAVIQFEIARNVLANFETLVFTSETANDDFWDFVEHNRTGHIPHRPPAGGNYEVVFGPVSVWPQKLVIKDCDQISFHTDQVAGRLVNATIIRRGSSGNPRVSP